jgi:hypothetical protein
MSNDVIFEMVRVGAYARMTATHVGANIEVAVVGPATGAVEQLKRAALAKLERRIALEFGDLQQNTRRPGGPTRA